MGMKIEEVKEYEKSFERSLDDTGINFITLRDYVNAKYILKDQYEARLKDMVAMLEEIKDSIYAERWDLDRELDIQLSEEVVDLKVIEKIIQQKIDALKGERNEQ